MLQTRFFQVAFALILVNMTYTLSFAQVAINTDGSAADESAMLHVKSTAKGVLIPSMTTSQRTLIPNPSDGLLVYDTDSHSIWCFREMAWEEILNTDTQELSLNGDTLSIEQVDSFIDLSTVTPTRLSDDDNDTKINVEEQEDDDMIRMDIAGKQLVTLDSSELLVQKNMKVGFVDFTTDATLNTIYPFVGAFFVDVASTNPSWQSFTAEKSGKLESIDLLMGNDPDPLYDIVIYDGEGTAGAVLGTSSMVDPSPSFWYNASFPDDEIILEKGRKYTIWFSSRRMIGYELNNLYPDGMSSVNANLDYCIRVFSYDEEYGFTIENGVVTANNFVSASVDAQIASLQNPGPVGSIIMWPTSAAPTGWLLCNGSTFNATTYPALNTVLGGNTLPDFRGRFALGVGNSGTTGSTNHGIGSIGGTEKHQLTENEMPSHDHGAGNLTTMNTYLSEQGSGAQDSRAGVGEKFFSYNAITGNTAATGGDEAHNNMPPFFTINYIIKAQ